MGARNGVVGRVLVVFGVTAAVLAVPAVAMRLTGEVAWTLSDFVVAGVLLSGTGVTYVLLTRATGSAAERWGFGFALGTALFLLWAVGAVGVIGSEDDPANLMFIGVLAVALAGALAGGLRPRGMARAMVATAAAQALVAFIAIAAGIGEPENGAVEVVLVNALYIALWLVAAGFFRRAADGPGRPANAADATAEA